MNGCTARPGERLYRWPLAEARSEERRDRVLRRTRDCTNQYDGQRDILHICKQSNVGCVLYEDKLPINEESKDFACGPNGLRPERRGGL